MLLLIRMITGPARECFLLEAIRGEEISEGVCEKGFSGGAGERTFSGNVRGEAKKKENRGVKR